jgi:aryl-alcohol dehydrogenase-like predicted oxidoreductase
MTVPSLGFGTAAIMGRVSHRRGAKALERAYIAGIRHFDTARSYGWGEAEGVVGAFLQRHRREEIRLVTKCGIVPVRHSPALGLAKSLARAATSLAPGLRERVRRVASGESFQPVRTYDIDALAASLRTSLEQLNVSYIDDLLLHNFVPERPGVKDIVAWFKHLQRSGTIRRFGFSIESDLRPGLEFLARHELLTDAIIQVPASESLLSLPQEWRNVTFIAHSPFAFLARQTESDGKTRTLGDLLLRLGDACCCECLVCAMYNPTHLAANVASWRECTKTSFR